MGQQQASKRRKTIQSAPKASRPFAKPELSLDGPGHSVASLEEDGDSADDLVQPGLDAYAAFCGLLQTSRGDTFSKKRGREVARSKWPSKAAKTNSATEHDQTVIAVQHQDHHQVCKYSLKNLVLRLRSEG